MNFSKNQAILSFWAIILIVILLYLPILLKLFNMVIHREGSSHGLFVPLLSLYFIWLKRSKLKDIEIKFSIAGLIPIVIGIIIYFLEIAGETFFFQSLSFIILISGLLLLFTGKNFFKEIAFPVLFLICIIPIPQDIYISAAEIIRNINLGAATWIMSKTKIPFLQKDLCILLPNTTLSVNIACSGIRYLLSFFVFGIAYAYIFRRKLIDRILLILLTIPISIFAGAIRLSVISFCAYYIGAHLAEHRPHVLISWFVFFIIGISLIFLDRSIMKHKALKKRIKPVMRYGDKEEPKMKIQKKNMLNLYKKILI